MRETQSSDLHRRSDVEKVNDYYDLGFLFYYIYLETSVK